MALSSKLFPALLLLLLVASDMGPATVALAEVCQFPCGSSCREPCAGDDECSALCRSQNQGYNGGVCRGAHLRCTCLKDC
ncbi:hypothetical protein ACP70R_040802 [Stipagrostis hirtigluma subsp. patula]